MFESFGALLYATAHGMLWVSRRVSGKGMTGVGSTTYLASMFLRKTMTVRVMDLTMTLFFAVTGVV